MNTLRNHLTPEHINMLMFLSKNLPESQLTGLLLDSVSSYFIFSLITENYNAV